MARRPSPITDGATFPADSTVWLAGRDAERGERHAGREIGQPLNDRSTRSEEIEEEKTMTRSPAYRTEPAGPMSSLDQLRRELDTLFGSRLGGTIPASARRGMYPPVNLYETDDAYILTAELAGIEPDDIDVSLEGTMVTLRGERKIDYARGDEKGQPASLHRRERQAGTFRRAFEMPAAIEVDKVEAIHKHGILMLRMPKSPEHQPRKIDVQAR